MVKTLNDILSAKFNKAELVSYFDSNPDKFKDAISLALSDKQPYAWRAAWILCHYMSKNDERLQEYIIPMIEALKSKKDGHQRELLKILNKMHLNEDHEGPLFDECMTIWESVNKSPSVRMVAFRFIVDIARKYPDLKNEIKFLTQSQYQHTLSPGLARSFDKLKIELINT